MIRTPCIFQIFLGCEYQEIIFKVAEGSGFGFFSLLSKVSLTKNEKLDNFLKFYFTQTRVLRMFIFFT